MTGWVCPKVLNWKWYFVLSTKWRSTCHWQNRSTNQVVSLRDTFFHKTNWTDASIWKDSSLAREWMIISTLMSRPPRVSWFSVVLSCSVLFCAVDRRSKRSSRLSALKSKSIVENKKEEEPVPALQEEAEKEIEIEDPPEIYQPGDIIWLRVGGNPWWPALIYGRVERFPRSLWRIRSFL